MQGDECMEIKKFDEIKEETVEQATTTLELIEQAKEINAVRPNDLDIKEQEQILFNVLENPEEAVKEQVSTLASTAAQIKEVGLPPDNPAVSDWLEQELGINSIEFTEILNDNSTPQDVEKDILKRMEAPKDLIDNVTKSNGNNKSK